MYFGLVVVLVVVQALGTRATFSYTDCTPSTSQMHITKIALSPDPIVIPGDIHLSIDGYNNASVSHAHLHLVMKKKHAIFGHDLTIPCLSHIGSCDYADICTIINDMETQNWGFGFLGNISKEIKTMFAAQNIDVTHCPFSAGAIHIGDYSLHIPKLPSGLGTLASLAKGDYHAEVKLTDSATNNVLLCVNIDVSVGTTGGGGGFLFGKK